MTDHSPIFNRRLVRRRRERIGQKIAMRKDSSRGFLFDHLAKDMAERLGLITRNFNTALNIGWHGAAPLAEPQKVKNWLQADLAWDFARISHQAPAFVADEEALPLRPQSLDLITNILSLHWVNDLPGCLTQIRQALKPDGVFLAVLFTAGTLHELRACLLAAESETRQGAAPHMIPLADVRALGNLLTRAGFALPVADVSHLTVRYDNIHDLMRDIQNMAESQALNLADPSRLTRATLARAQHIYAEKFSDPDGRIRASFSLAWLLGWAPDQSQPRPLKPGSAKTKMADALALIRDKKP